MADKARAGTSVTREKTRTVIAQAAPNPSATTPTRPRRARASMTPGAEGSRDLDRDGLSIGERMATVGLRALFAAAHRVAEDDHSIQSNVCVGHNPLDGFNPIY